MESWFTMIPFTLFFLYYIKREDNMRRPLKTIFHYSTGEKTSFPRPQVGHSQLSGRASKGIPSFSDGS